MAISAINIALRGFVTPLTISLLATRGFFVYGGEIPETDADLNIFDIALRGYRAPLDYSLVSTRGLLSWLEEPVIPDENEIINKIRCIAPQYADSELIECRISLAENMTGNVFGNLYDYAVALRVCHWFAIDEMNGGNLTDNSGIGISGAITEMKEGDLSEKRSYNSSINSMQYGDLGSTRYGIELIRLINSTVIAPTMGGFCL